MVSPSARVAQLGPTSQTSPPRLVSHALSALTLTLRPLLRVCCVKPEGLSHCLDNLFVIIVNTVNIKKVLGQKLVRAVQLENTRVHQLLCILVLNVRLEGSKP